MSVASKSARGVAPLELVGVIAVAVGVGALALAGMGWVPAIVNFVLALAGGVLYVLAPGSRGGVLAGTSVAVAVALLVEFLLWETSFLNQLIADMLTSGFVWVVLVVVVVGLVGWLASVRDSVPLTAVTVVLGVAGLGGLIYMGTVGPYQQNQMYLQFVKTASADGAPEFKQRAALPVAHAQAQNSMTTIGELESGLSAYVPQQDRFTTLVQSKEWFGGYTEVVNQKVALTGQSSHDNCQFDRSVADKRLGGWLQGNLTIWIAQKAGFGTVWEQSDAYGYCDADGAPIVVQPLLRTQGVWPMIFVPAGDAVYNGRTGELRIVTGADAAALPGPAISEAWAKRLWQSTTASADWWSHQQGLVGWSDTSRDANDPNADNRSEFTLSTTDGHVEFVSPLTKRGAASGIAGLSTVSASAGGGIPTMTIWEFGAGQQRQSNSAAVDRIKAAFGDLSWASGLQVFEITPISTKSWVASIGLKQNVVYRVLLSPDQSACLETATGEKVRCVNADQTSTGTTTEPGTGTGETTVPVDSDLSKLTDAQLADLVKRIDAEVQRRLRATGK